MHAREKECDWCEADTSQGMRWLAEKTRHRQEAKEENLSIRNPRQQITMEHVVNHTITVVGVDTLHQESIARAPDLP